MKNVTIMNAWRAATAIVRIGLKIPKSRNDEAMFNPRRPKRSSQTRR
jgi:hypothetical protein